MLLDTEDKLISNILITTFLFFFLVYPGFNSRIFSHSKCFLVQIVPEVSFLELSHVGQNH